MPEPLAVASLFALIWLRRISETLQLGHSRVDEIDCGHVGSKGMAQPDR
jgi:hypothetical protein